MNITLGFLFEVPFFIFICFLISDGQHQYRLLNCQFLTVSLCTLKASGPLCSPCSVAPINPNMSTRHVFFCLVYTKLNVCPSNKDLLQMMVSQWDTGDQYRSASFSVGGLKMWPHNVSSGLLLTASLHLSCTMLLPGDWLCLCWLTLLRWTKLNI